ncbi:NAD-dependent epimerase/dehydratase family protein [Gillisia sp. M10.2A]|uniref:NAD-dependent epimerase/dehydratase family protein n=1 Tax=Gillisia lutea TaxID=2909668 RepID=A0ABS9EFT7_9FLAO|nr:NAD-dependent epimerase/dehydratase family protein [Gillisia lutea]MCF4100278.1 NAD-dependent epimerase/dehydratase family protein [Gillisia lutea]
MILVTGGTGLVGSHLLLELVKKEEPIRAIYRENSNIQAVKKIFSYYVPLNEVDFLFGKIEWRKADLLDIPDLTDAFIDVTTVYHCAALVSFDSSKDDLLRKINIEGTANIVNLCVSNQIEKLCYISSIAAMDLALGEQLIQENFTWHPETYHNEYAISKRGAEIEVWRGTQEGVPAIILNPGVIIGPGFWKSGSGKIFSRVEKGLNYHFPKITGFVGVMDVVNAAITCVQSSIENEQYILVSENKSFKEVLDITAKSLNKRLPEKQLKPWMVWLGWVFQSIRKIIFRTARQISKRDHKTLFEDNYYSNDKIKRELAFEFTPITTVIKETGSIYKRT